MGKQDAGTGETGNENQNKETVTKTRGRPKKQSNAGEITSKKTENPNVSRTFNEDGTTTDNRKKEDKNPVNTEKDDLTPNFIKNWENKDGEAEETPEKTGKVEIVITGELTGENKDKIIPEDAEIIKNDEIVENIAKELPEVPKDEIKAAAKPLGDLLVITETPEAKKAREEAEAAKKALLEPLSVKVGNNAQNAVENMKSAVGKMGEALKKEIDNNGLPFTGDPLLNGVKKAENDIIYCTKCKQPITKPVWINGKPYGVECARTVKKQKKNGKTFKKEVYETKKILTSRKKCLKGFLK